MSWVLFFIFCHMDIPFQTMWNALGVSLLSKLGGKGLIHNFQEFIDIYCIRHIFCESNFSRIGTSRHFRE